MKKKDANRRIGFHIMQIIVCIFCAIALSYAWYSAVSYEGNGIEYEKNLKLASNKGSATNYVGVMLSDNNEIVYEKIGDSYFEFDFLNKILRRNSNEEGLNFKSMNLYPSSKIYFKTEISNDTEDSIYVSLFLNGFEYSRSLAPALNIVEVEPDSYRSILDDSGKCDESAVCVLDGVRVSDNIEIEEGKMETVYWYIEILGNKADNSCMDAYLNIASMLLAKGD